MDLVGKKDNLDLELNNRYNTNLECGLIYGGWS